MYTYVYNIQNDVTHLLDASGNVVASYEYDAYGNHLVKDSNGNIDSNMTSIGNINPIRYRGYLYNREIDLYYCKTRFYDSKVGRFISMDSIEYLDFDTIHGLNLYAYCRNNPVMYVDPSGHFLFLAMGIITGALLITGATLGGISAYQSGRNVFGGILEGVFAGALIAGSFWLVVGSFLVSGGLASNLGLMMFTYGYSTLANMVEVAATQIRYSHNKGEPWWSNLTRSMAANVPSIYLPSIFSKSTPFITQFAWHIDEKYSYTIPGEGGIHYDYMTTSEAWGMFKNYLSSKPSVFSCFFAMISISYSTKKVYNAIFGTPDYDKWILF